MSLRRSDITEFARRGAERGVRPRFRVVLPLLTLLSIGLLVLSRLDHASMREVRWRIAELMTPVLGAALVPLAPVRWAGSHMSDFFTVAKELQEVREENQRLKGWEWRAGELERKLEEVTRLSRTVSDTAIAFITVRVIANSSGAFVRSAMINAGKDQNLKSGYPVISADGIVGRVVETGRSAARVLLLTDLNSRIPVLVGKTGVRAVLAGDNGSLARLNYVPADAALMPGDEVMTSGTGGLFPRGLRIGTVVESPRGLRVRPHANLDSLEFLSVLFYESPTLELTEGAKPPQAAEARPARPEDTSRVAPDAK